MTYQAGSAIPLVFLSFPPYLTVKMVDFQDEAHGVLKICIVSPQRVLSVTGSDLKRFPYLRCLDMKRATFSGSFRDCLMDLKCIRWKDAPPSFTVTDFNPKNLVILDLSHSEIKGGWVGWKHFKVYIPVHICAHVNSITSSSLSLSIASTCSAHSSDVHSSHQVKYLRYLLFCAGSSRFFEGLESVVLPGDDQDSRLINLPKIREIDSCRLYQPA